jgi:hypothetical protein
MQVTFLAYHLVRAVAKVLTHARAHARQEQKLLLLAPHASVFQASKLQRLKYGLEISSQGGPCQER